MLKPGQSGAGLLTSIVSIGIFGFGALLLSTMMSQGFRGHKSISLRMDKESLKQMILNGVSCASSNLAGQCTAPGVLINLQRLHRDGSISTLVSNNSATMTRLGSYAIRAECNATLDGAIVRATRVVPGGSLTNNATTNFRPDPLTSKITKWADPESLLFGTNMEVCSGVGPLWRQATCTMRYEYVAANYPPSEHVRSSLWLHRDL